MEEVIQAISTVGFPIACCLMMGYLLYLEQNNHKEEMLQLKDAIVSNTLIMTELKQLLEDFKKNDI